MSEREVATAPRIGAAGLLTAVAFFLAGGSVWALTRPALHLVVPLVAHAASGLCIWFAAGHVHQSAVARRLNVLIALGLPIVGVLAAGLAIFEHFRSHVLAVPDSEQIQAETVRQSQEQLARLRAMYGAPLSLADLLDVRGFDVVAREMDVGARSSLVSRAATLAARLVALGVEDVRFEGPHSVARDERIAQHTERLTQRLDDPDEEVRIHAYEALRDLVTPIERATENADGDPALRAALALRAVRRGLVEGSRRELVLEAASQATAALRAERDPFAAARELEALLRRGQLGDYRNAHCAVRSWLVLDPPLLDARARIAYGARDWRTTRRIGAIFERRGWSVPTWMEAVQALVSRRGMAG